MSPFWKQLLRLQIVVSFLCLCTSVDATAKFVNPSGADGSLTLTMGDQFLIAWQDAGSDYSELSLGVLAQADGNIFWLISNDLEYTSSNYLYTVALGNGITLQQGNIFSFILVNGTSFGEQVLSPLFTIKAASSSSSTTTSSSTTSVSSTSTSASSATSTATSATTSATTSSTSSPTASATSVPSTGLSTGAKIGVGVAVPIAALAVLGTALMLFMKRRKGKVTDNHYLMSPTGPGPDQKYTYAGMAEAPASNPPYPRRQLHEAPSGRNEGIYEAP